MTETVDAKKQRFDGAGAVALLDGVDTLLVAKGKKVTRVDLRRDRPDDDELTKLLLGPSGNLRAPTMKVRRGRTMLVGFNAEMYEEALG